MIKTTVVGSYPVPMWLRVFSTRESLRDAIMAVSGRDITDTKNLLDLTRRGREFRLRVIGATDREIIVTRE